MLENIGPDKPLLTVPDTNGSVPVPGTGTDKGFLSYDLPKLTLPDKEAAVVRLLALGRTHKSIADEFKISPAAVDQRRKRALNRLGITTSAGLVHYAIAAGLCEIGEAA